MKKYICATAVALALLSLCGCQRHEAGSSEPTPTQTTAQHAAGWVTEENVTRYYLADGTAVTGKITISGSTYYFDETGAMQTGWITLSDGRYYFGTDGIMTTGWTELDSHRYYLNADGRMATGWQTVDAQTYYFLEDGRMARGQVEIDGVRHFFTSTGAEITVVNPWNAVPDGYDPDLVSLGEYYGQSGSRVSAVCLEALKQMIQDCNDQCTRVYVVSSYRTYEYQQGLFERRIQRFQNEGYSRTEAEKLAATVVALPGTSEHHLGLAVDIVDNHNWSLTDEQADMPGQQWLMEHSWEYGFILRYPKDSTDSTGIIWEPWHYRYVGKELAQELHQLGVTLETYLENLSA